MASPGPSRAAGRWTDRRAYPDTPAGHLIQVKDDMDDRLWRRGHRMKIWRHHGGLLTRRTVKRVFWHSTCKKCGLEIKVGLDWSSYSNPDGSSRYPEFCPGKARR